MVLSRVDEKSDWKVEHSEEEPRYDEDDTIYEIEVGASKTKLK